VAILLLFVAIAAQKVAQEPISVAIVA